MGTRISKKCIGLIVWPGSSSLTWCTVPSCSARWSDEMAASRIPFVCKMDCGICCIRPRTPNTAIRRTVKRSTGALFYPEYVIIPVIISCWRCRTCYPCREPTDDRQEKHRATQNRDTATYLIPAKLITDFPFNMKCGPGCTKKCVS